MTGTRRWSRTTVVVVIGLAATLLSTAGATFSATASAATLPYNANGSVHLVADAVGFYAS